MQLFSFLLITFTYSAGIVTSLYSGVQYTFNDRPSEKALDQIIQGLTRTNKIKQNIFKPSSSSSKSFYGYSKPLHIKYLRRQQRKESDNRRNSDELIDYLLGQKNNDEGDEFGDFNDSQMEQFLQDQQEKLNSSIIQSAKRRGKYRIIMSPEAAKRFLTEGGDEDGSEESEEYGNGNGNGDWGFPREKEESVTSGNFEVIKKSPYSFLDIGGYENIKQELLQTVSLLTNFEKYAAYNVRVPKGLILEGPPGNGKTLLAKGLSGQINASFIAVSGSQFQEKYVGVGASRIRELFRIARKNRPCIVFIDEIDAIGRKRSDGESSSSERDSTLNELLVALDGFKNSNGVFLIGATNRYDLLDAALTRPGRIDKKIYLGNPDTETRRAIVDLHIKGKPFDSDVLNTKMIVTMTKGMSGAQVENVLNEAMLNALRMNRTAMVLKDIELGISKMTVGWQPVEHEFTEEMLQRICVHEMGHFLLGLIAKNHPPVEKVMINLFSPRSPGYTTFEPGKNVNIYTKNELTDHLMILLGGRIAEELIYSNCITTGASNDLKEASDMAHNMVEMYAMSSAKPGSVYISHLSEKSKEAIDDEVIGHLEEAAKRAYYNLAECKDLLLETADMLMHERILLPKQVLQLIKNDYSHLNDLFSG